MDSSEAIKIVIDKISSPEPEHIAKKIIGYMYFQGLSEQEMIRLALGPDSLIHDLIQKAKNARLLATPTINLSDPLFQFAPFTSVSPPPFPSPSAFLYWDPQLTPEQQKFPLKLMQYSDHIALEDPLDTAFSSLSISGARISSVKTCHYYNKGFCKYGSNCRYYHGESFPESYPHMFTPNSYDAAGDDHSFSSRSLDQLELEITELLKSRRGNPVSIASLPMLYYEKYGKNIEADGYLTESQRHGKAGYSLTKLLARLKNRIHLIDRPHGQHAVILAEYAAKYVETRAERNDPGPIVNGSRQIYLTFPAESTFNEEDVYSYFSNFGPVQDVRIPCQQKRMFGFVNFVNADTVNLILCKGNPHYVCDARVLVKLYREKAKLVERKYLENFDHPGFLQSHPTDIDLEFQTSWDSSRLLPQHRMEEPERAMEFEAMRFAQLQLADRSKISQFYSMDELKMPEGHPVFPSEEHFNYLFDVLKSDDNPNYPVNNYGDHESTQGVNLPDSPLVTSSISAVI